MNPPATAPESPRNKRHSLRLLLVLAAIAFALAETGYQFGALAGLDNVYTDLWHRVSGKRFEPAHVVLVEVDETSLAKFEDPLAFWAPLHARALTTLREAGASVIGVDFLFSVTPEAWLQKYKLSNSDGLKEYDLAFRQELGAGKTVLVGAVSRGEPGSNDNFLLPHTEYLLSLPNSDLESGIGLADLIVDSDGSTRRFNMAPPVKLDQETAKGAPRLTLGALLAVRASGQSPAAQDWSIGGRAYRAAGARHITYAGPPGTIPRVSFHRLLEKNALRDPAIQALRGKVVIVGANYEGMNDVHGTAYSNGFFLRDKSFMSGPEIQAAIVETLLSGKTTSVAPDALRWVIMALVLLAAIAVGLRKSPWWGLGATLAGAVVALGAGYGSFQNFWLFPSAHVQLGLLAGFLFVLGLRLTREERDKAHVRALFEGYASDEVVNLLLDSDQKLDVGGQAMHITVLFSDIRNFTTISEKLSAHETVEFLNVYFPRIIDVIKAEGGRIDKFIGDAVMAEFGAPFPFADHPIRALRAAARMRQVAEEFKVWMDQRFPGKGLPPFGIGIGVHTGNAVVGEIGTAKKKEFTAIGDTVNVASRLEGETKAMSCVIVASADTVRAAGDRVVTGRHDTLTVKGRAEPIEVYEILDIKA